MARKFSDVKEIVKTIPDNVKVVLLGECTHGTEEFYQLRADITKYLIRHRRFSVVVCESDWPFMYHVNQYVQRKKINPYPKEKDGGRFPQWMWHNKPFLDLVNWMRQQGDCSVFGMDCYCKEESMAEVCKILKRRGENDMALRVSGANPEEWPVLLSRIQHAHEASASASSSAVGLSKAVEEKFGTKFSGT